MAMVDDNGVLVADIPGLIEGASMGIGLGTKFLKHVERCKVLIHLIDATQEDVVTPYKTIRAELKKYSPELAKKPEIVALNKIDALLEEEINNKVAKLKKVTRKKVHTISGVARIGIADILRLAYKEILKAKEGEE